MINRGKQNFILNAPESIPVDFSLFHLAFFRPLNRVSHKSKKEEQLNQ